MEVAFLKFVGFFLEFGSKFTIWMHIIVCVCMQRVSAIISMCEYLHMHWWCVGSFSVYKCVSACAYICVWECVYACVCVCVCSCPRCALLISYQGSLFAGWQVAISPLIQGLFVRWELCWEHMTKHFTSLLHSLASSLSLWILLTVFSSLSLHSSLPSY